MNEIEIFNKYSKLNPYKGINREDYLIKKRTNTCNIRYYLLESWITGEPDKWYTSNAGQFKIKLKEYNLNYQIWYDIAVLGLTDIKDRPNKCKCPGCNNEVEFALCFGYRPYCSKSCQARATMSSCKNYKMHDSWKQKLENPDIRREFSEKQRNGMIEYLENNYNKDNTSTILDRCVPKYSRRTKTGYYISVKSGVKFRYLSSWELDFLKLCDSLDIVKSIEKPKSIRYIDYNNDKRLYIPDFYIILDTGDKFIVEIKPRAFLSNKLVLLKKKSALEYCKLSGDKYIIITEDDLYFDKKLRKVNHSINFNNITN